MIKALILLLFCFSAGSDKLEVLVESYLKSHLSAFEKYEYEIVSKPKNIINIASKVEVDNSKEFRRMKSYGYIPVIISSGNNSVNSVVTVKLKLYQKVYVATQNYSRGDLLERAAFELNLKEVSSLSNEPVVSLTGLKELRAKTNIRKGAILTEMMLEMNPDIKMGETVNAYLEKNGIVISMSVTARQDGRVGQTIRIATNYGQLLTGIIEENNKVKIVE
ncbi:MAG TPA: flagellar basal body P-ring formation chaperone FlgA [Ignavibacteriaceae bacterium]|nr:flagellar basal body P-ring formation chaperone FlgA [Ignavibacteriaceae bacterium]